MPALRVCKKLTEPQYYEFPSKSEPGTTHTVIAATIMSDYSCDCKGFHFKGECAHIKAALELECDWAEVAFAGQDIECPQCGGPTEDFDPIPRYTSGPFVTSA